MVAALPLRSRCGSVRLPGPWMRLALNCTTNILVVASPSTPARFRPERVWDFLYDVYMLAFRTSGPKFSRTPHACRRLGDKLAFKTPATASSYVFLQQELARGLRLSQPSRVAKDAARGELVGDTAACVASLPNSAR